MPLCAKKLPVTPELEFSRTTVQFEKVVEPAPPLLSNEPLLILAGGFAALGGASKIGVLLARSSSG